MGSAPEGISLAASSRRRGHRPHPSWVQLAGSVRWGSPGSPNLRVRWRFGKGSIGLIRGGATAEHSDSRGEWRFCLLAAGAWNAWSGCCPRGPGSSLGAAAVKISVPCSPLAFGYSVWTKSERRSPTARCKATPARHCRHLLAFLWRSTALQNKLSEGVGGQKSYCSPLQSRDVAVVSASAAQDTPPPLPLLSLWNGLMRQEI